MPAADPIALLLAGRYPDAETNQLLGCESRTVVIEDSLVGHEADLIASLGLGANLAIICDVDTYAAMGARVERALAQRFTVQCVILPEHPHADVETIAAIAAMLQPGTNAIVTVGSGTLNDLSKMVALQIDRPHVVFATAPSMNGYTSVSASITEDGMKRSVRARTPHAVFMDLGVLAAAPVRMIRAGLGDSICRPTAQADWLLSHLLLGTPYRDAPFALLAADEAVLLARAASLVTGDLVAIRALARTLVLSGFGMTLTGGSYPASQGEHLVSHYLEMMAPPGTKHALHGEQTGVAAINMAELQAGVLAHGHVELRSRAVDHAAFVTLYGPRLGETCFVEFAKKQIADHAAINRKLATEWPLMRARISAVAMPPRQMVAVLAAAGAPTTAAELGYPGSLFDDAIVHAREIRDRYTFLDFAAELA